MKKAYFRLLLVCASVALPSCVTLTVTPQQDGSVDVQASYHYTPKAGGKEPITGPLPPPQPISLIP